MTNNIYELRKLSGMSAIFEHADYSKYVSDLEDDGYTVDVDDSTQTLVFTVTKDGESIAVKEPESGSYNVNGKTYSSLKAAVSDCLTCNEWANSPNNQIDDRETVRDQPEGGIVDMSLRRLIGANAAPVQIEENTYSFDTMLEKIRSISSNGVIAEADAACDDEEADEAHDDGDEEDVALKEGFKDKLKILALLGLTGMAAHTAADALSAKSTPLGIALQQAADQGDSEASHHLKNLGAYIDSDTSTLRDLNRKYLKEGTITSQDVMESYRSYKSEENKMVGNDDLDESTGTVQVVKQDATSNYYSFMKDGKEIYRSRFSNRKAAEDKARELSGDNLDESPSMSDESSDDEDTNWDQMMMDIDMDTTEEHGEYVPLRT